CVLKRSEHKSLRSDRWEKKNAIKTPRALNVFKFTRASAEVEMNPASLYGSRRLQIDCFAEKALSSYDSSTSDFSSLESGDHRSSIGQSRRCGASVSSVAGCSCGGC